MSTCAECGTESFFNNLPPARFGAGGIIINIMANICSNKFYCTTDVEKNYLRILYWLYENFSVDDLDGETGADENWMAGAFFSKWAFPEKAFEELTKELSGDESLYIRVVSFEPGNLYLEGNVYRDGCWEQF